MSTIKNHINTYATTTAYNTDLNKDFPNVSYIQGTDEVKWNKYDPDHIVAVYNVTSTESATKLLYMNNNITYQIIDGVQQQSVQTSYTFSTTGEHIVKYKLNETYIYTGTFRNCRSLTSVTIPNSVTWIDDGAFYGCSKLTSITIPDSVTSIGSSAFNSCSSLTSVTIPSGVTFIRYATFQDCSKLTSVTIPNSVTWIDTYAFKRCSGLTNVTIEATTPPTLGTNVFSDTNNCPIYVPAENVDAYKAAANWSTYASRIQAIPTT